jgi:hypothetical protein
MRFNAKPRTKMQRGMCSIKFLVSDRGLARFVSILWSSRHHGAVPLVPALSSFRLSARGVNAHVFTWLHVRLLGLMIADRGRMRALVQARSSLSPMLGPL